MRKLPIIVLIGGIFAMLIAWFWPSAAPSNATNQTVEAAGRSVEGELLSNGAADQESSSSQAIASPPQAITSPPQAQNQASGWLELGEKSRPRLSEQLSTTLQKRFDEANQMLKQGSLEAAAEEYAKLTDEFPNFVEPYVNLASVQAELGQLEAARLTLAEGVKANQSTEVLFNSINKLHGALAAQAYRSALETSSAGDSTASLPKVGDLATDFERVQQIASLTESLAQEKVKQASLTADSEALNDARQKILEANDKIVELTASYEDSLKTLQTQLDLEAEKGKVAQGELANLQDQAAKAESDMVAKLRIELREAESALQKAESKSKELLAVNQDLSRQLATAQTIAAVDKKPPLVNPIVSPEPEPKVNTIDDAKRAEAIELVRGWASAWSSQNVANYLKFYLSDYSSSSNLSHEQWVAQRRVRLTNKSYIKVDVRDFSVSPTTDGFAVTFTQHYRSNTLDDTIRKRISFVVPAGATWRSAKIKSEKIVNRS